MYIQKFETNPIDYGRIQLDTFRHPTSLLVWLMSQLSFDTCTNGTSYDLTVRQTIAALLQGAGLERRAGSASLPVRFEQHGFLQSLRRH